MKVVPLGGLASAVIVPLCLSIIFLQIANPIPVPSNWLEASRRWKGLKMRSKYFSSNPIPLSVTFTLQYPSWEATVFPLIVRTGGLFLPVIFQSITDKILK